MTIAERMQPVLTPAWLGSDPVPTGPYASAEHYALEQAHIFRDGWIYIGQEAEVPEPGAFVVKAFEACDASVLITRTKSGSLRAFHNICSHRGNRLVWEDSGSASRFVCNYHAWTFDRDGELRGVTDSSMFFDLDRKKCGLSPIHLACWRGFMFLNFAQTPEAPLIDYLGGLGEKLAPYPFEKYSNSVKICGIYEGNWKVAFDAFQESYHLGYLHKNTIGPFFGAGLNPSGRMISAEFFGPHRSGSIWGNDDVRPRPIESTALRFGGLIVAGDHADGAPLSDDLPPSINPLRDPNWALEMNVFFPNLIVFVNRQGFIVHSAFPLSHDRTRWEAEMFFQPISSARQAFAQQFQLALSRDTFVEDGATINFTQQGLRSGALKHFQFQDNEVFPRHSHAVIQQRIAAGISRGAQPD